MRQQVPSEEWDDLAKLLLMLAYRLGMLVGLASQEQIYIGVIKLSSLGGRCFAVLVQEVKKDCQLHRVAGELTDVRFGTLRFEIFSERSTIASVDSADITPLA